MKERFGEYIHKLRVENGMTLTKLAAALDIDQSTLSKIENNKRKVTLEIIPKLANCFDLNVNDLEKELLSEEIALLTYDKSQTKEILQLAEEKAVQYQKLLKQ